jgi:murein DD-endopeptidase MepM/ murein hydrolase activator NlpD
MIYPLRIRLLLFVLTAIVLSSACEQRSGTGERLPARRVRAGDIVLADDFTSMSARVVAGSTFATLLRAQDIAVADVEAIIQRAASVFDLRKLRRDQPYRLDKWLDGTLKRFDYEIDGDRLLRVSREDADLVVNLLPIEKTRKVEVVRGRIDSQTSSLVAAMDTAGETIDLTLALADVFSGDIDFNTDLQPGDRFELLVEKQYRERSETGPDSEEEVFAGYGPILAAQFDNDGHRFRAVRFTREGGEPGYFDEKGTSMRRFFLKSPLKFDPVITSNFSRSRLHPVLHVYRAHLGVDYRAAAGAPVVAVANGTVVSSGMNGGAGRMVHLRHANGFETEYLHLSSIAVKRGAHVRQGDLIGRVGATGLATAPHLDYRVKKNGVFVNPVAAHGAMPPAEPIPQGQLAAFLAQSDRAFASFAPRQVPAVVNAERVSNPNAPVK